LRVRLDGRGPGAPLEGLQRAGWRVVYRSEPNAYTKKLEQLNESADHGYSIGAVVARDGKLTDVIWNGPAFKAGLSSAMTIIAVNGREYGADLLEEAIEEARDPASPVELLVKHLDRYRTVKLDYTGGLRYPHLERIAGRPDVLVDIFRPRAGSAAQ
jgi:predicted metalloprotease with PDZ domain